MCSTIPVKPDGETMGRELPWGKRELDATSELFTEMTFTKMIYSSLRRTPYVVSHYRRTFAEGGEGADDGRK
jgi:hypothetical protein